MKKFFCFLGFAAVLVAEPGWGQNITLDGTLGPAGTLAGPEYGISQGFGTTVGTNLFHSFGQFDLAAGERANFASDASIQNILARVTGGTASSIDGLLFTNSAAVNLFLINPSGIVFGSNARLDVGGATRGSFFATTLDGVVWPDGGRFGGVEPQEAGALLNIVGDPSGLVASQRVIPGIEVNQGQLITYPGQSLVLLGGDVLVDEATVATDIQQGGSLTLGGLAEAGTVGFLRDGNAWQLGFPVDVLRGNVKVMGGSLVTVQSNEQGELAIYGRDVEVLEGSRVLAGIAADGGFVGAEAGDLLIEAQGQVEVAGSRVANDVESRGTGAGGDLRIVGEVVEVTDGAQLGTVTSGIGDAGNVLISAGESVLFQNFSAAFSSVQTGGEGKGGSIVIDTPVLEVRDGAQLLAGTEGKGDAGNVLISAGESVLFQNIGAAITRVETEGKGKGGNIVIDTPVLEVKDGAALIADTSGTGDAGNVQISAGERALFQGATNTGVSSSVLAGGEGKGGNIVIDAPVLEMRDGAQLLASTFGTGDAGNVQISAGERALFQGANTGAISSVETMGEGKGGNIVIDTPVLEVRDGAVFFASTSGKGNAGNVLITSGDRVFFQNGFAITRVESGGEGNGGNIVIDAPVLEVNNGAVLIADTLGTGDAGNVLISAGESVLFQNLGAASSSVATGGKGKGGNVMIDAPVLEVRDGAQLLASTFDTGDAGNVQIAASDRILFQNGNAITRVATGGKGKGGNIIIDAPVLEVRDSAELIADTSGKGNAGNVLISAGESVLFQNGFAITRVATGGKGKGGNVVIDAPLLEVKDGAQVIASTLGTGDAGNVQISASKSVLFQSGAAITRVESGGEGNGGNVVIDAPVLKVNNGAELIADTSGKGNAGNVQISASDRVLFQNGFAFSNVGTGGEGKGGNVVIDAPILEVMDGAVLVANTQGIGDAGNVLITAGEHVLFQGANTVAISSVARGGEGKGGNIVIGAPVLQVKDGAQLIASTLGTGDAGNVQISASKSVLFQSGAAITRVESGGEGNGGNVVIDAPVLKVNNGAELIADTEGKGNAGNVRISASDRVLFQNGFSFSSVATGGEGNGGNVVIDAPFLEVKDGAQLIAITEGKGNAGNVQITAIDRVLIDGFAPTDGLPSAIFTVNGTPNTSNIGTGRGGEIALEVPQLTLSNGAVINASTANDQPGGNITLSLDQLALLSGGQILTISNGSGTAGTLNLTATNRVQISGTNPIYTEFSTLSVRSNSTGPAGNIILNSPNLTLTDGGRIIAESSTGNGGNLFIGTKPNDPALANLRVISPDAILLRNGSLISATAGDSENPGDGGNITINSPFLIGFPNENSDIIANAFSGTGGKITINADAILNFRQANEPDSETLRSNSTNDISASSAIGTPGTLNLAGLNVDPAQGTTPLPTNLITPADQVSRRCAAERTATTSQSEFFITGRSGLPLRPGDAPASSYSTGTIATTTDAIALADAPTTLSTAPLTEAASWQKDAQGNIQLIASSQPLEMESNSHCDRPSQNDRNS